MTELAKFITRRRFAALFGCVLGITLVRPVKALASLGHRSRRSGSRLVPLVVSRRLEVYGSADLGDVVMRRGTLALKDGGRVDIRRLESR